MSNTYIRFENITERDMDLLLMRKFCDEGSALLTLFLKEIELSGREVSVLKVAHSVATEYGESDIEVLLSVDGQHKIALLIEDKINAPAMKEQASRYKKRGEEAVKNGEYKNFYTFIVAPKRYLQRNSEAKKYDHRISYESIKDILTNPFEIAIINQALNNSKIGDVWIYNKVVTDFWDRIYDYVEENYNGMFRIHGKKGLQRSGIPGQWITISCNNQFGIQIKSDRGYVDLEIKNYADRFEEFCKDNKTLIDNKKLYIRTATKSLAIRRYIECIDFTKPFEEQEEALKIAFDSAKELQDLIREIRIRS